MRRFITFLCFLFGSLSLSSQTVVDFPVEQLYINGDHFFFYTLGKRYYYNCSTELEQIADYRMVTSLYCREERKISRDSLLKYTESIAKYSSPQILLDSLKAKGVEYYEGKYKYVFEYFSDDLMVKLRYEKIIDEWVIREAEFYDFYFLRLKSGALIISTIWDSTVMSGYIIPTKKGWIWRDSYRKIHALQEKERTPNIEARLPWDEHYRVVEKDGKYTLFDLSFEEQSIDMSFDKLHFFGSSCNKSIIGWLGDSIYLFDHQLQTVNMEGIKAASMMKHCLQVIHNDQLKWKTVDGKIHDTIPMYDIHYCHTHTYVNRAIIKQKNEFVEIVNRDAIGFRSNNNIDTLPLWSNRNVKTLQYLNTQSTHEYNGLYYHSSTPVLPYDYYLFETDKTRGIVKIVDVRDSLRHVLDVEIRYPKNKYVNKDSLQQVRDNLPINIRRNILFEDEFDSLKAWGYYQYVRFEKNGLFGFFPIHKEAKYKQLGKYQFHFANFELTDGRKGWIDRAGKEYFKEE